MIPKFPKFRPLQFSDKDFFYEYTSQFLPYSDFNFVSLWSYDDDDTYVSMLNDNLVIKMADYTTGEPLFTYLGGNMPVKTIESIFELEKEEGLKQKLEMVPEVNIEGQGDEFEKCFQITEDRNNFDYVFSVKKLANLKGRKLKTQRVMVNKFKRMALDYKLKKIDLSNSKIQQEVRGVVYVWSKQKNKTEEETETEAKAINKLLLYARDLSLFSIGLYIENKMVGFFISEILNNKYAMGHFRKADKEYSGIFQYIDNEEAKYLEKEGVEYFNYEQDLGDEGMRKAKMSYKPEFFLKKYIITPK